MSLSPQRPARNPPTYASPAPFVSTSSDFSSLITTYVVTLPSTATMVGSLPCVITTVRGLPSFGSMEIFAAMSSSFSSAHPSVLAKVAHSVSLPKRTSMYGIVFVSTALKGGTSMRNGADRLKQ